MKQILSAIDMMSSLCWPQKVIEKEHYRKASFSLALPIQDGILLYNSLTGEMLLLSEDEYSNVDYYESVRETLIEKYFLVTESFNEKEYTDQIMSIVGLMKKEIVGINGFKIFTTTDCNARCFYCYEKGRSCIYMNDDIAHTVADYICRVHQGKKVRLNWFGGEPLLNMRAIDLIVSDLNTAGVKFDSTMISNGYLFNAETINKAHNLWKLQTVQVTIDGTRDVYNRTKAYKVADANHYQRVLNNIAMLLDAGISVKVRMNVHKNNVEDIRHLIDELSLIFSGKTKFSAYIALLQNTNGDLFFDKSGEALEYFRSLNALLVQRGLRKPKELERGIILNYCMADDDSCITILPDGRLGKCEHYSESEFVGSLFDDELDASAVASWKEKIDRIPACDTCPYYPRCNYLKKCSYTSNTCTEFDRQIRLDELKEKIYTSYVNAVKNSRVTYD